MNNINKYILLTIILTKLFLAAGCTPGPQQQEYITIGALLPLTGESSDEGLRALNGLHLAKEEINANGGILGKMLDIIILNDRGCENYITEQYHALMERGVVAIIGSSYSGPTLALAKEAEKDGVPVISPTASNPAVTKGRNNIFRAIFIDDYQSEVMAFFAYNLLGAKTAVVLSNRENETYVQSSNIFADFFTSYGGQVIAIESHSTEDDFPHILQKHIARPPDVFFCPEDYIPASKLINTAYSLGFRNTHILGSDAWDGILTYVFNQEAMENAYYTAPFSFDDQDPKVVRFVRDYIYSFAQMPLAGSATVYTCVYILAEAIKKAGSTDWGEIVAAMKENDLDLVTGRIKFDDNNNPHTNVYVIQIKNGVYSTYIKLSL